MKISCASSGVFLNEWSVATTLNWWYHNDLPRKESPGSKNRGFLEQPFTDVLVGEGCGICKGFEQIFQVLKFCNHASGHESRISELGFEPHLVRLRADL